VILFSIVRKITTSKENRGELLSDEVMKTTSHRNCPVQVTLIEHEQRLLERKWEFVFTLQSHFVDCSQDPQTVYSPQYSTAVSNMTILLVVFYEQ